MEAEWWAGQVGRSGGQVGNRGGATALSAAVTL